MKNGAYQKWKQLFSPTRWTWTRSAKSSSRKTHLEDARAAPHSPRFVPTNFDVSSETELIEGEDHRTLWRLEPIVLQKQSQKDKELVEEPKSLICRPEEGIGNDPRFGRRPSGVYQLQTSSRGIQREAQRTSEEEERSQDPSGKGKGKENWHRPYPKGYRIPKLELSAVDSVFNMARTLMEFTAKEQERMNRTFPPK
ncbi:hypothetical protein O181_119540 [Austropuccinia psidii MF-1]|uniref:Uncharacterized protein n=1 Tax=Austropuccinia psidii MF-1 TaxID=1389203 RepID=A0A9Q3KE88_9BASI|nr:hypothetical protein [Austropuccinia psidii MF-1]